MPLVGFEPEIPATKRPQTYSLDSAATGIGTLLTMLSFIYSWFKQTIQFEWLTLLRRIREVPVSNLGSETGYPN
jgi:hypothetical protein